MARRRRSIRRIDYTPRRKTGRRRKRRSRAKSNPGTSTLLLLGVLGFGGWYLWKKTQEKKAAEAKAPEKTTVKADIPMTDKTLEIGVGGIFTSEEGLGSLGR